MKVVQVLPNLNGGGVEKGTLEIAEALVQAGHESIVISAGGRMVEQLVQQGSQHIDWDLGKKSPLTFRHIWAIRKWLKQQRPDILHLRSRMPAWVVWLAWRGLPKNHRPHLVTTVHGLYSVSKYSEIMCKGERVIAVSETVENYIRDNYPATDMSHVELIYRGVDPAEFPYGYQPPEQWLKQWQHDFPQLAGKKILTLPGRLTRLKGHHDFIDLVIKLKQTGEPIHGLIVGGEDPKRQQYATELRKRIDTEGLDDTITFTGNRSDIREIYAISDVVLSLSTKPESFGRAVLEALSLGV
ncbi:MAG: glycosyltransferase, partial [Gammaproteobacteria bacterium]|nr:glycosyltransferase [Gammaproteobacteria bacterium]